MTEILSVFRFYSESLDDIRANMYDNKTFIEYSNHIYETIFKGLSGLHLTKQVHTKDFEVVILDISISRNIDKNPVNNINSYQPGSAILKMSVPIDMGESKLKDVLISDRQFVHEYCEFVQDFVRYIRSNTNDIKMIDFRSLISNGYKVITTKDDIGISIINNFYGNQLTIPMMPLDLCLEDEDGLFDGS